MTSSNSLLCVIVIIGSLFGPCLKSGEPAWWERQGIIAKDLSGNRLPATDFAVINQGQLKNFVAAASAEFDVLLAGGRGILLDEKVESWTSPDGPTGTDFAAANIGQAKALAALVYDRLIAEGVVSEYPWTPAAAPTSDFSMINIGQVKALFSFDLDVDSDSDGINDLWEKKYFGNLGRDGTLDFDGDGVSDLNEWLLKSNPVSSDSDSDGMEDGWEFQNQFDLFNPSDGAEDADGDGWTNVEEALSGTNPRATNATLPGMAFELFAYDLADRLNGVTAPAGSTLSLDFENNILSSQ